ncbi:MAG TPA: hypothetical protein VNZ52_03685 [Candidatus Thermoplasmatota archaeon]|nr:hypothetical protein [Candidatus Thermoplasmatota archaeon]
MKTMLIIETAKGREKLLNRAEETLEEGEAIVKITDTISVESTILTVPTDPDGEVIAREPPKLLPGGVTALISYVKCKTLPVKAMEYRLQKTEIVAAREVTLKPERTGRPKSSNPAPAAP